MKVELVRDDNKPYLTEYHLSEFCFCDEEIRHLYECRLCKLVFSCKKDEPPKKHRCGFSSKVVSSVIVKIGDIFSKECIEDMHVVGRMQI